MSKKKRNAEFAKRMKQARAAASGVPEARNVRKTRHLLDAAIKQHEDSVRAEKAEKARKAREKREQQERSSHWR